MVLPRKHREVNGQSLTPPLLMAVGHGVLLLVCGLFALPYITRIPIMSHTLFLVMHFEVESTRPYSFRLFFHMGVSASGTVSES